MSFLEHKKMHPVAVVALQAAIFSLAHIGFAPAAVLPYFLPSALFLGLVFGAMRWASQGQWAGFALHGVLNFMSLGG